MENKNKILIGIGIIITGISVFFIIKHLKSKSKDVEDAKDNMDNLDNIIPRQNVKNQSTILQNKNTANNIPATTKPVDFYVGQHAFAKTDTNLIKGNGIVNPVKMNSFVGNFVKYEITPKGNKVIVLTNPAIDSSQYIALANTIRP